MPDEHEAPRAGSPATRAPGGPASAHDAVPGDETPALSRRAFVQRAAIVGTVAAIGAAALVRLTRKTPRPLAGGFVEDGAAAGHRLRDGAAGSAWPVVRERRRAAVVVVGGGMAGLSAAWWMARHGMHDVAVLELQSAAGGNSRSGETAGHAHPWGAHYLPLPDARATYVRALLEEMGVLANGRWRETDLCAAPKERTFAYGRWREGLVEAVAAGAQDRDELRRFAERVQALRATGAFTIPMASGVDAAGVDASLDRLTMDAWLAREGFRGGAVRWMADYACRDDFGTLARDTSAWAALHYFAARDEDDAGPLTWPEGNGRIVAHLLSRIGDRVVPSAPVHRVERANVRAAGGPMRVLAGNVEWTCDAVVWAAPTFLSSYVVEGAPRAAWSYGPWMVANLVLDRAPAESALDHPPAWDNVIADSPALGYVVASHQALRAQPERQAVWTHYWALAHEAPAVARRRLWESDWRGCAERVLADLERAHPDVRACVSRVDVRRYGHAMPRPVPGFLAERERWWRPERDARVLWANSDVSGLSLFEEAQYRGVVAAERAMALAGRGA